MANRLEELPLYSRVLEFWDAVSAILRHSQLRRNRRLFAKGSLEEVVVRMKQAQPKELVSHTDLQRIEALSEPLGKMMGGFIKYLRASGFTDRGRHGVAPTPPKPR